MKRSVKKSKKPIHQQDVRAAAKSAGTVLALLAKGRTFLPGLAALSVEERKRSTGRIGVDEEAALRVLLDVAERFAPFFAVVAAQDGGQDDARFEAGPARDDLARRALLGELEVALEELLDRVRDTRLVLGARVRQVTTPLYDVAKTLAARDPELRAALERVTDYYAMAPRARSNKAARASGATPAP